MNLTRRRTLQLTAAGLAAAGIPRAALAQSGELTIAYNVALPSWDATTGPSAVNPTIQAIYQAVFDQYVDQEPDLSFVPGILTEWGWSDDRARGHDDRARGRHVARRLAAHARGRGVVARARRRGGDRQPDAVPVVEDRQLPRRRPDGHGRRDRVRPDDLQVDGVPHGLRPAQGVLRGGRSGGLRGGAHRFGPLQGRALRARRLRAARGQRGLLGRGAGLRGGDDQVRHRRREPRGRGRVGLVGRHARDPLRGVRPA